MEAHEMSAIADFVFNLCFAPTIMARSRKPYRPVLVSVVTGLNLILGGWVVLVACCRSNKFWDEGADPQTPTRRASWANV
jgi:hypothetical protein